MVGVGRFTSPDAMVSQVRRGVLDMIGAARPSIADPFLPKKVEEGRIDDIRECIGCNICAASDNTYTPIRCTQNPTMGEEWRRNWHPEKVPLRESEDRILVIGAGPAGLECAMTLGKRGYEVGLAESTTELGGRVAREAKLPGLSAWGRVRDYRVGQLHQLPNVSIFLDSKMSAQDLMAAEFDRIVLAVGSSWRRDGVARYHRVQPRTLDDARIFTPDDIMAGAQIEGPVVIYDDDHYYMGGAMAEMLRQRGLDVTLVTPAPLVSNWTVNTLEQPKIQSRLLELGVSIRANEALVAFREQTARACLCVHWAASDDPRGSALMVTSRLSRTAYNRTCCRPRCSGKTTGIKSVTSIGDCLAPGTIAQAVFGGHRYAREFEAPPSEGVPFQREIASLGDWPS